MKILKLVISSVVVVFFTGCASMFVPDSDQINKLQIVKMGEKNPEGHEFILHIPAGVKIPVRFSIKGSMISVPVDNNQVTKLNRDIYVYKHWASLDGKKWKPTGDIVHMPIAIGVDSEGGQIDINVDMSK